CLADLADVHRGRENYSRSAALHHQVEEFIKGVTFQGAIQTARRDWPEAEAGAHLHRGKLHEMIGRFTVAEKAYEQAETAAREIKNNDARRDTYRATALNNLAWLYHTMGNQLSGADARKLFQRGEAPLAEALQLRRQRFGADHPLVAHTLNNSGL